MLRRAEAAETALTQLASVLSEQLPATRAAVVEIAGQARQSLAVAEELAAGLYLHALHASDTPDAGVTAGSIYMGSLPTATELNDALRAILPRSDARPHPLALGADVLTAYLGEPKELETAEQALDVAMLIALKDDAPYVLSALVSPTAERIPTLLLRLNVADEETGGPIHFLAIAPHTGSWRILTVDTRANHYFTHRQAQYVANALKLTPAGVAPLLAKEMERVLIQPQSAKVRAFFKAKDDTADMLTVLLGKIFAGTEGQELTVEKEGLYSYKVGYGEHPQLGRVIIVTQPETQQQVLIRGTDPTALVVMRGNEGQPTALTELEAVTQNLLLEILTALAKKVSPAKKKK